MCVACLDPTTINFVFGEFKIKFVSFDQVSKLLSSVLRFYFVTLRLFIVQ